MSAPRVILEFDGAVLPDPDGAPGPFAPLSLRLEAGQAALLEAPGSWDAVAADLAGGLRPPAAGALRFLGADWTAVGAREATRLRHRIGRVFGGAAWLSNLDVDENVVLGARHFSGRGDAELLEAANRAAVRLGLSGGLPAGRPAWADRRELQLAQWVRATLDEPDALIIENPDLALRDEDRARVRELIDEALRRGAAVLGIAYRADGALAAWWPEGVVARLETKPALGA